MILLIRQVRFLMDMLFVNLHFTMILLIPGKTAMYPRWRHLFTFHYDSINSAIPVIKLLLFSEHLHFTMILLIRYVVLLLASLPFHLHFTMILLIPVPKSSPYLCPKTSLFCRPLQNSTCLSSH